MNAAMARPQKHFAVLNCGRVKTAHWFLWIPQRHVAGAATALRIYFTFQTKIARRVAPQMLIGHEDHLHALALGQLCVAAIERPLQHVLGVA